MERSSLKGLSLDQLAQQLDRLIQDQADNQRIFDWVEVRDTFLLVFCLLCF